MHTYEARKTDDLFLTFRLLQNISHFMNIWKPQNVNLKSSHINHPADLLWLKWTLYMYWIYQNINDVNVRNIPLKWITYWFTFSSDHFLLLVFQLCYKLDAEVIHFYIMFHVQPISCYQK
jgi:hypothetical protein